MNAEELTRREASAYLSDFVKTRTKKPAREGVWEKLDHLRQGDQGDTRMSLRPAMLRDSNMELLRILSMFMIVFYHCVRHSAFSYEVLTLNTFLLKMAWMLGECGVNIFVLISGYYLVCARFRGKKLIQLLLEVMFYWVFQNIVFYLVGGNPFPDAKTTFLWFFPVITGKGYWFVTAYVVMYILSPWLNSFIKKSSQKSLLSFLVVGFILWSFIPSSIGAINDSIETIFYFNPVIWFVFLYIVGAYLRLYPPKFSVSLKASCFLLLVPVVLMALSIALIWTHPSFFKELGIVEPALFWHMNTVLEFFASIGVFCLFKMLKIPQSKAINRLASATFGVYLFHELYLGPVLWTKIFHLPEFVGSPVLFGAIFLTALIVYCAGTVFDLVRQGIFAVSVNKVLNSRVWTTLEANMNHFMRSKLENIK